jgi:hypothetical protein
MQNNNNNLLTANGLSPGGRWDEKIMNFQKSDRIKEQGCFIAGK